MKKKAKPGRKKSALKYVYRSAVTGGYIPKWYAELHPKTTMRQIKK
jgi:hypothetical protein